MPWVASKPAGRVKGFDSHLIFYEPRSGGVFIVRVLHAASNWWQLLGLGD
jgi:toxin ParE1/3/4